MATFGSFETERDTYSGPTYTVYSARKQGDPTAEYAVKVFSVHHLSLEQESAEQLDPLLTDIEKACVQRIAVQQKAAEASKLVAPIFETGSDERGVWYATRFYPRSVNKIISGRVALNEETLQHIIVSIAKGALEIKRACGRSHGEILPSNVQISRSERLSEAEVVLSDPMPGTEAEAVRYELSDLRGIGRILLQLVLRREIDHEEDFLILPILASPEWTELFGKETDTWLALCNRLLDPNLSLEQLTLEQLVAELEKLKPETGIPPKVLIAAGAGVVVLVVLLVILLWPAKQTVEVTSDPEGATILVGEKKERKGKTPLKLKLQKGSYAIEARQDDLRLLEQTTNWVVQGGGSAKLHFKFPYGTVSIDSDPTGATITSNGVAVGKTPMEIPFVAAGAEVKYDLAMEEHVTRTVQGTVTNGGKLALKEFLPLRKDTGTIVIESTPSGTNVNVYLDGKPLVSGTPSRVQYQEGKYTLTARYRDWPPKQSKEFEVKKENDVLVRFNFEYARVSVDSDPQGATVFAGTNLLGTTPTSPLLPAGENTLHFELAGFDPTNATLTVADKISGQGFKQILQSSNGVFHLKSDPVNARIFDAGGRELGQTVPDPDHPMVVSTNPGSYKFVARLEGLIDVTETLTVGKRETKEHTFHFDYGSVSVESDPSGAMISVNGKPQGATPKTFVQKPGAKMSYQIAALNYLPTVVSDAVVQSGEYEKRFKVTLEKEPVSVALASVPPGAEFYTEAGTPLKASGDYYSLPWGLTNLIARHRRLVARTNAVDIPPGKSYKADPFKFVYGTLVLTNLEGYTIKEGADEVQNAAASLKESYEVPGMHTYKLYDGEKQIDTLTTNIGENLFTVLFSALAGDKRNSIGMRLVKVRNLLGPGQDAWVGKTEVTQGEYKAVMGDNPSDHPVGPEYPVEKVNWLKASEFCKKLTDMDTNAPTATGHYSLPTHEQWSKYADVTDLNTNMAVYGRTNSAPVGSKLAGKHGLYDVWGNVSEWLVEGSDPTKPDSKDFIGGNFKTRKEFGGLPKFTDPQGLRMDQSFESLGFRVIWVPGK